MDKLSIKLQVVERLYPLTIDRKEEEVIRRAAKIVNDSVEKYKKNFAFRDNQDLLAMSCLQLAAELLNLKNKTAITENEDELLEIDKVLTDYLDKVSVL